MEPAVNPYQTPILAELVTSQELPAHLAMPPGAIGFSGAVTVKEAREADRLLAPWYHWHSWGGIAMLLALAMCLFFVSMTSLDRASVGDPLYLVLALVSMAGYMVVLRLRVPRLAQRFYEQRYGTYAETTGYVSPEELVTHTTFTSGEVRWPAFRGYKASINIILLFWDSAPGFVILARGKFASADDWNAVLGIVSSRLGPI